MKKFVSLAVSCLLALGAVMGFAACGDGEETTPPPHKHIYSPVWSFDQNEHWREATCPDGVEDGLVTDQAAHGTPGADGKCPTCGYKMIGQMTLDEFKETASSAEKIRDFARRHVIGFTDASIDFVWATADADTNKLATLTYLYFDSTGTAGICSMYDADVAFEDIMAGTAVSSSIFNGGISIHAYDLTAQTEREALGAAAFEAYKKHPDTATDAVYDPTYTTPSLMRLVATEAGSKSTLVYVLDIFDTGFVQYRLAVSAGTDTSDAALIELLTDSTKITSYYGHNTYTNRGELLYSYK